MKARTSSGKKTIDHLITTNNLKLDTLTHWVQSRSRFLNAIGSIPVFTDFENFKKNKADFYNEVIQNLKAFIDQNQFLELFLVDVDHGRVMVSTNPQQEGKYKDDQAFFKQGQTDAFIQDIVFDVAAAKPVMIFSMPLFFNTGTPHALLAGIADLTGLSDIFEKRNLLNITENTYLVNKFNYFVTEPRFGHHYALRKSVMTTGTEKAKELGRFIGSYPDYRGVEVLGEARWLEDMRLYLISEIDQSEIDSSIFSLKVEVLLAAVIIAALSALAGWLIAGAVTRPLTALMKATRKVGQGEFQTNLDISRPGNCMI